MTHAFLRPATRAIIVRAFAGGVGRRTEAAA